MGIPGLALAFALAYFVGAALALFVLHDRLGGIEGRRIATTIGKVLVAGAAVAGSSWAISELIGWSSTLTAFVACVVGVVVGGIVYLGLLALLRVEELTTLTALIPGRGGARPGTRV